MNTHTDISTRKAARLTRIAVLAGVTLLLFELAACVGCGSSNSGNRRPPRVRRPRSHPIQTPTFASNETNAEREEPPLQPAAPTETTGSESETTATSATSIESAEPPAGPTLPLEIERIVRPIPPPLDLYDDAELQWISDFGPGGMIVPRLPDPAAEEEGLTHLAGVVFPEGTSDILFVGRREPGYELITTEDLIDAFVVAWRAAGAGSPPGVSIDPRPGQLAGGLNEGDLMDVVYFGGVQGSEYGFAAFESDRLMKCLSAGKDNISREPVTSSVPGYQSELALYAEGAGGENSAWHRFWIEIDKSDVAHSEDNRTLMAVVKLAVRTEYMQVSGGKLVSGNRDPDPVAKYFANHLTDHYAEYGKEFPIFNRLGAFAVLTSVAAAIRDDAEIPLREEIENQWRIDEHQFPPRETPTTTPAVVATHGRAQLTGGVKLQPNNQNHLQHPRTQALQQDVLASRPTHPGAGPWSVASQGVEYQVIPARPRRARRTWQQDLAVGSLRLVRENGPRDAQGKPTPGWFFRLPRLQLDTELVNYEGAGKGPKAAHIYDEQGRPIALSKFGKLTMPGNPATPGYGDQSDTRNLYMYANGWMYLEGDIDFVSINGGPPTAQLGPDARVIEFSPKEEDGHRVESVQTADGKTVYEYDGQRLARMRNQSGDAIRFDYDTMGRLTKAIGSDGQSISYSYDDQGRIASLAGSQGSRLSYLYGEGIDAPLGVRAELRENPAIGYQPALQARIESPSRETPQFLLNDPLARHVSLEFASDGSGDYLITVRGKGLVAPVQERLSADANTARYNDIAQQLRKGQGLSGAEVVLVTGPADVSQRFAGALRSPDLPDLRVYSAVSATLADQNLHSRPSFNGKVRVVIHTDKMLPQIAEQLQSFENAAPDADVVLVIGHNTPSLAERKLKMGNDGEFAGRNVGFIACPSAKTPSEDDNALRAHAAVSVTGLGQPIPQSLLPYFVPAVVKRLEQLPPSGPGAMRKDQTMESIFREAADEVEQLWKSGQLPSSIEESDIQLLRLIYERVGQLDPRRFRPVRSENEARHSLAA